MPGLMNVKFILLDESTKSANRQKPLCVASPWKIKLNPWSFAQDTDDLSVFYIVKPIISGAPPCQAPL